jgi:hypothetical protein
MLESAHAVVENYSMFRIQRRPNCLVHARCVIADFFGGPAVRNNHKRKMMQCVTIAFTVSHLDLQKRGTS